MKNLKVHITNKFVFETTFSRPLRHPGSCPRFVEDRSGILLPLDTREKQI